MLAAMIEHAMPCLTAHGFVSLAYVAWEGPTRRRPVVCVHGLTRNGRDFDRLAAALATGAPVFCPDMPGRGKSQWLDHAEDYAYPTYVSACAALLARIGADEVDWVGTSMGGIIGMFMAALPGTPIRRLVLNDLGAFIPATALSRLATYVGSDPSFASDAELETDLRRIAAPFGRLSDADWKHLARISTRRKADGTLGYAYDPRIGNALRQGEPKDVDLWATYDAIGVPTLLLRGAESDLLRAEDARAMTQRGPRARLVEFAGVGHAPALMADDQIAHVRAFLDL
ncbi:MAG TPA: alpha/beta fold hydrolase [Stellaceae bacterium]|nr:alpha/beta fold hydrolase [Stellaceae bacterium]